MGLGDAGGAVLTGGLETGDSAVRAEALRRLREAAASPATATAPPATAGQPPGQHLGALDDGGVRLAVVGGPLQARWEAAVADLRACLRPAPGGGEAAGAPVLIEGADYDGTWLESTGTASADVLTRFAPRVARATMELFAVHQRDDGLLPYKVTADGPAFSQVQAVTPLARAVWRHHRLARPDPAFLRRMHRAMAGYDAWLAAHRNTLGTGGVEAFCSFDTGHDLSPRFWGAPERCLHGDAARVDTTSTAAVPYVAPDLTAFAVAQRTYLARSAEALGEDPGPWRERAAASARALTEQCWDADDACVYDRDRHGHPVRLVSDVLTRVLACEVVPGAGGADVVEEVLRRHLLSTRRLLTGHGLASLALDDPRFDGDASRNSWAGPVNLLTQLRAPDAFEPHGHVAELALVAQPVLAALLRADRYPQCLDPWSGAAGHGERYSPAALFLLDAVERWSGVLPRPDGALWLTGLVPTRLGGAGAQAVAYARQHAGVRWELAGDDDGVDVLRSGAPVASFPRGWRLVATPAGAVTAVVGVAASPVAGTLRTPAGTLELQVDPDEVVALEGLEVTGRSGPVFVPPQW